jgi:hypothetical protein
MIPNFMVIVALHIIRMGLFFGSWKSGLEGFLLLLSYSTGGAEVEIRGEFL